MQVMSDRSDNIFSVTTCGFNAIGLIEMEIQESSLPIFYVSRILGLAPYTLKRSNKGRIESIQLSYWLCGYSAAFLLTASTYLWFEWVGRIWLTIQCHFLCIVVSLILRFLVIDSASRNPIRWVDARAPHWKRQVTNERFHRMLSATANFVTIFDVMCLVVACLCGGISGIIGLKGVREMNRKLSEADNEMVLFHDQERDRRRGLILLSTVFVAVTAVTILDSLSKRRSAMKLKTSLEMRNKGELSHLLCLIVIVFRTFPFNQNPMKSTSCLTCHFICSITSWWECRRNSHRRRSVWRVAINVWIRLSRVHFRQVSRFCVAHLIHKTHEFVLQGKSSKSSKAAEWIWRKWCSRCRTRVQTIK